jgi:hypothetical protein
MAGSLGGRVGRLENGREEPCPECGWDGDPSKIEYVVEWQDADGPTEPDEFCETCGRQLASNVQVTWGDSPGSPGRR